MKPAFLGFGSRLSHSEGRRQSAPHRNPIWLSIVLPDQTPAGFGGACHDKVELPGGSFAYVDDAAGRGGKPVHDSDIHGFAICQIRHLDPRPKREASVRRDEFFAVEAFSTRGETTIGARGKKAGSARIFRDLVANSELLRIGGG